MKFLLGSNNHFSRAGSSLPIKVLIAVSLAFTASSCKQRSFRADKSGLRDVNYSRGLHVKARMSQYTTDDKKWVAIQLEYCDPNGEDLTQCTGTSESGTYRRYLHHDSVGGPSYWEGLISHLTKKYDFEQSVARAEKILADIRGESAEQRQDAPETGPESIAEKSSTMNAPDNAKTLRQAIPAPLSHVRSDVFLDGTDPEQKSLFQDMVAPFDLGPPQAPASRPEEEVTSCDSGKGIEICKILRKIESLFEFNACDGDCLASGMFAQRTLQFKELDRHYNKWAWKTDHQLGRLAHNVAKNMCKKSNSGAKGKTWNTYKKAFDQAQTFLFYLQHSDRDREYCTASSD